MNGAQVQPQYPAMPTVSDTKPLLKSFGATGTAIFSGIITSEEYNPDFYWRDGVKIYEQMLRNDAQVNATREMLELPIRRATWSIQPASDDARDQEIAAFVRACLFDEMCYTTTTGRTLHQKWDDILRHILLHLSFGFMAFEVNWRVDDGFVKWARWTPLLPRTVWRWWVGADNELAGIQQWTFKDYSYCFVDIPADKLLLFTRRQEGNNFEGVSVYRSAYKHWWMKQNFERIDAVGIERNAVVPPVIHLPLGFSDSDVTQAQQIGQNLRVNEMMSVTLPPGWDLEYPKDAGYSFVKLTPTQLKLLAECIDLNSASGWTRCLIVGGEQLTSDHLDPWRTIDPPVKVVNEYGPAETVVGCSVESCTTVDAPEGNMPIGKPIPNARMYLLDEGLRPVLEGVPGQIYIAGEGLARGYLGRPDLTAAVFVPDPFSTVPGARMYRTGDRGRYLPGLRIEYLGRGDTQVKIRGFRAELGEIEAIALKCPGVEAAVALLASPDSGSARLVLYWTKAAGDTVTTAGLRDFLVENLPPFLTPSVIVELDSLPLLENGKVDKQALPTPESVSSSQPMSKH